MDDDLSSKDDNLSFDWGQVVRAIGMIVLLWVVVLFLVWLTARVLDRL